MSEESTKVKPSKGVPFELDGKQYFIRFSLATIEKIQDEFGELALTGNISGMKLAQVLFLGMKGASPDLTLEDVGEMIDTENLEVVVDAMTRALGRKTKAQIALENPPAPSPVAATGSESVSQ
jgi:hypothetical protein